jgi:hypothetical protein
MAWLKESPKPELLSPEKTIKDARNGWCNFTQINIGLYSDTHYAGLLYIKVFQFYMVHGWSITFRITQFGNL